MLSTYLPIVSAILVAAITAFVNYRVGSLKTTVDVKTLANNASDALRDDLLEAIDRYERREQFLVDRIERAEKTNEALQITLSQLREEVAALRIENQGLKVELQKTRTELALFERKVYYVPPTENK